MKDEDRTAITTGLTLHAKGQAFLKRRQLDDALTILELAFESLSQVSNKSLLWTMDNYALLCIDICWIYYLKSDKDNLKNAQQYLHIASVGLEKAHGKNKERIKALRGGNFIPESININTFLCSFELGTIKLFLLINWIFRSICIDQICV